MNCFNILHKLFLAVSVFDNGFPLLAVPMFVLAGIVMAHGKISQKLFDVFVYFIGKRTAGIPCGMITPSPPATATIAVAKSFL